MKRLTVNSGNSLKRDPTRTTTLRRVFSQEAVRRYEQLRKDLIDLIVTEDAFGLRQSSIVTTNARWSFMSTIEKLNQFAQWLKQRLDFRILGNTVEQIESAWWYQYVMEGFKKGAGRSFDDVRKRPTSEEKLDFFQGRRREFLQGAFGRPESIDKVKLLAGRVLTDLKGVNDATATVLSRTLTDGLVQGKNPRDIASDITKVIDTVSKRRATTIARTEVIRAHAEGQLLALEKLGVTQLGVQVEWSTTGDDRVCPLCQPLEGIVITLDEAKGMLPRHPNCRCSWIPAGVGERDEQKDTQSKIKRAITKSILAERPKRSKGGIAKAKLQSKWSGADKRIAKNRPKSILRK